MVPIARVPIPRNLLVGFQTGDPQAREQFPRAAGRYIRWLAAKYGGGMPADLLEEIEQEVFADVLANAVYDPVKGSVETFLGGRAANAARKVRSTYASPVHVGRDRRPPPERAAAPRGVTAVQIDKLVEAEDGALAAQLTSMDDLVLAAEVFAKVRPLVAEALRLEFYEGRNKVEVAARLGVERIALHRAREADVSMLRSAA